MPPGWEPHRFLAVILGALLSTLGAMAALNVLVDPYAECGTQIFLPDDSDQHSRVMKVALLRRRDAPPQALILGNSRSLALSPTTVRALTGLRTFNAAAANANVWDVLAFTRYVLGQPKRDLRLVILGFDTFMLIGSWAPPDEQLLYFPLVRYLPEVRPPLFRAQLSRAGRLASANTAVISARQVYDRLSGREAERTFVFDADGMMGYVPYDDWVKEGRWPGPLPDAFENVRNQYHVSFGSAPYLGGRLPAAWEGWLREAQAAGVQVVVFVPPLNTKLARTLASETHYLEHLDLLRYYLRSLATRYHIAVHDLSTVDRFGGDDRWFIDGTHMIGPNNDLVLKAILKDVPRAEPRVAVR